MIQLKLYEEVDCRLSVKGRTGYEYGLFEFQLFNCDWVYYDLIKFE